MSTTGARCGDRRDRWGAADFSHELLVYARTSTFVGFYPISKKKPEFSVHKRRPSSRTRSESAPHSPLVLRFVAVLLLDAIWCKVQKPRADALRLIVRMGDPYDSFEGRIGIVDLIDKRTLYHRGQCGVKSRCRFLQIPE